MKKSISLYLLTAALSGMLSLTASAGEITLTMPLFFENRIPDDIAQITEAASDLIFDRLAIQVDIIPMLRLVSGNSERSTAAAIIQRQGTAFDIVHTGSQDIACLDLTDLLDEEGKDILNLFQDYNLNLLQYHDLTFIPSISDHVNCQGIAMRSDILEYYHICLPETLSYEELDDIYAQISPNTTNLYMISGYRTGRELLYQYDSESGYAIDNTIFMLNSDNEIINRYSSASYQDLLRLFRKWYNSGYLYPYAALQDISASEMVKAGELFSFICSYKPGIENELSESCGTRMSVIPMCEAYITQRSLKKNSWGIAASSKYPQQAMKLLNLLYTDEELANLLAYGIEGVNYTLNDNGQVVPVKTVLNDAAWMLPNQYLTYIVENEDPLLWERLSDFNQTAHLSPVLGFSFDPTPVASENAALNTLASQYAYGLETGQLDPEVYLPLLLSDMEDADSAEVLSSLTHQYHTWISQENQNRRVCTP